jgi:Flp pilus assembly protein CpaB
MATGGRRRGRVLIFVALILILLVALAWAVTRFLNPVSQPAKTTAQQNQAPTAPVVEMENIVISTQPIKRGTTITGDVITTISFPRSEMVEGAFITKPEDVIGKRAKTDLEARIPINPNMLVDSSMKNSPAAFQIPRGQVAISIPISNLSAVSYGLQSGDHVNVIVSLLMVDLDTEFQSKLPNQTGIAIAPGAVKDGPTTISATINKSEGTYGRTEMDSTLGQPIYITPSESPRPRLVSQTLIQDAVVLQLGNFSLTSTTTSAAAQQPTPVPGQQVATAAPVTLPDSVTLIVNPQDAVTLNYLIIAGGRLNLVMRAAGDDERIATEAVTLQFVLDQYNIPNPAKLPYGLEPRLDSFPNVVEPFPSSRSGGQVQVQATQNP